MRRRIYAIIAKGIHERMELLDRHLETIIDCLHSLRAVSLGSSLNHVFPFQSGEVDPEDMLHQPYKRVKKVAMDTRRMSSGSEISYRSGTASINTLGTLMSGIEGDTSIERLCRTRLVRRVGAHDGRPACPSGRL